MNGAGTERRGDGAEPFYGEIQAFARSLFEANPVERHPLFVELTTGRLARAEIQRVAIEVYHVVEHFPRLIAGLCASLPHWTLRMTLVENLYEEHGRMRAARVHVETYKAFLEGLGVDVGCLHTARPSIPVIAYNRAVLDLCLHHPYAEALGALGVIEEVVARASPLVARLRFTPPESGTAPRGHFSEHAVLDVSHAAELYAVAARVAAKEGMEPILQGMALGHYYHYRLYTDLLALARAVDCAEPRA